MKEDMSESENKAFAAFERQLKEIEESFPPECQLSIEELKRNPVTKYQLEVEKVAGSVPKEILWRKAQEIFSKHDYTKHGVSAEEVMGGCDPRDVIAKTIPIVQIILKYDEIGLEWRILRNHLLSIVGIAYNILAENAETEKEKEELKSLSVAYSGSGLL